MEKELDKYNLEATTLFRSCNTGILSTISKSMKVTHLEVLLPMFLEDQR